MPPARDLHATVNAFFRAYEEGMRAARLGPGQLNPYDQPDWIECSAWRQGYKDMLELLDEVTDLAEGI